MKWLYEKHELRMTPSVQKGLPLEVERRFRREGARFIINLGSAIEITQMSTMATGAVFFHRFYMVHTFQEFPRYRTACACLFLAGKVEETPKKYKEVLKSAREILPRDKFQEQFGQEPKKWTEDIMTIEKILLQTIKFELQVEHPHRFLLRYAKCLIGDKDMLAKMVEMSWTFVNDSLETTLCLQWEPEIIAIAFIYLALKLKKYDIKDSGDPRLKRRNWWDLFVKDLSSVTLDEICHQLLDLYKYNEGQLSPAPDSPPSQALNGSTLTMPIGESCSTNVSLPNCTTPQASASKASPPPPLVQGQTPGMHATVFGAGAAAVSPSQPAGTFAYPRPPPCLSVMPQPYVAPATQLPPATEFPYGYGQSRGFCPPPPPPPATEFPFGYGQPGGFCPPPPPPPSRPRPPSYWQGLRMKWNKD